MSQFKKSVLVFVVSAFLAGLTSTPVFAQESSDYAKETLLVEVVVTAITLHGSYEMNEESALNPDFDDTVHRLSMNFVD